MGVLTKSNVVTTVFGDMRVVTFEVEATTSGDYAVTGLDYIFWAGVSNEDATVRLQLTKNHNGTTTSNGDVYLDLQTGGPDTVSIIAIGK